MDPSSSNSEYQDQDQDQDHHRLGLQQREWLSCSTSAGNSTQMEFQDVAIDDDDNNNTNNDKDSRRLIVEREHMFDKVVTPSDVGKLNRLVIPKQHAEKYFPLDATTNNSSGNNNDSSISNSKAGLLLNFEDRTGKSWRFRYSYWNSSQSYVMTKGWSRFVKEKQLSAGDIVSFQRAVGDDIHSKNTFFIDWRRRPPDHHLHHHHHHLGTAFSVHNSIRGWGGTGGSNSTSNPTFFLRSHPHESHPHHNHNALWDHSNLHNNNNYYNYNNNNVTHLPPMNGNMMSMVPYGYGGGSGSGSGSVNPSGSLILFRSPVPNSTLITSHQLPTSSSSHYLHPSWTTSSEAFGGGGIENGQPKVYDSVPVVPGNAALPYSVGGVPVKRSLRLFGVNMEYDQHQVNNGSTSASSSNHDA